MNNIEKESWGNSSPHNYLPIHSKLSSVFRQRTLKTTILWNRSFCSISSWTRFAGVRNLIDTFSPD